MTNKTNRLPLTSDYVFKRIFGQEENKEALKDFLESILKISNVEINNPEIHTKLEQWLWLFIGGEEKVKKASKVNKEIERINKKLASMSLSREERNNYEFRLKAIRDEISAIDYATKKGLQQGREEGIRQGVEEGLEIGIKQGVERGIRQGIKQGIEQGVEKGKEEGKNIAKIEMIKEMLKNDITIEKIEKITKFSKEDIEEIRKEIKI